MVAFIVQARVGSSRLPNKILLPFYGGQTILDLLIEKLQKIVGSQVIIAAPEGIENDLIADVAKKHMVKCYRGDESDVLQRFIGAAETFNVDRLIRVCSDNPFLELQSIRDLVLLCEKEYDKDYISFKIGGKPSIRTHYGFWTEYVTLSALKKVAKMTSESIYHEHVTNYIYNHEDVFNLHWIDGPEILQKYPNIRLTIDTLEDFKNVQKIYAQIRKENSANPTIKDIIIYLDQHPEYYKLMNEEIIKNNK
ncbi:MAG: glycosyl transferase family 2 [Prevotella sp.]|nr:glycosyl transferase family 2 [Prevotella sp.]